MCGFSLGCKIAMGAESTLSVLSAHSQQGVRWKYAENTLKVRWKYAESTLSEPLFASEMVHAPSDPIFSFRDPTVFSFRDPVFFSGIPVSISRIPEIFPARIAREYQWILHLGEPKTSNWNA